MFEELGDPWGLRKEEGREDLLKVLKVEKVSWLEVLDTDKECLWWSGRHKADFQHIEIDDDDNWQWTCLRRSGEEGGDTGEPVTLTLNQDYF